MSVDGEPKVLEDPLAAMLLGAGLDAKIAADRERLVSPPLIKARALSVMRSRYAGDELAAAISRGVTQYVVLGADSTRRHRSATRRSGSGRSVDHPDTQRWKLRNWHCR
jgi:O-methyltransferase involved in polyketide biosynthesis